MKFFASGDLEVLENCRIDKLNNSCKIGVASAFVPLEENERFVYEFFHVVYDSVYEKFYILPDSIYTKELVEDETLIDVSDRLYLIFEDK